MKKESLTPTDLVLETQHITLPLSMIIFDYVICIADYEVELSTVDVASSDS
jgi:hypothetical protein